ncbi:hypothetical protein FTX61_13830 [Nitriliruptoraceae bacterium ZYF776]|nr:hypothetical protein [Profundirhabdus halotolerans]
MSDHVRFPDGPPAGLLDLDEVALLRELGGPTWLRLPGTGELPPRAVVTLLHGDEPTGLRALLRVLRRRGGRPHPFDLHVVVGNVEAALAGPGFAHRYLDGQPDLNRIWGAGGGDHPLHRAAEGILGDLLDAPLASLVDVHNTTGDNPFYAIVPEVTPASLNLATLFTSTVLRWDLGAATLMEAVADRCPAIAVECGLATRPASLRFAVDALRRYLGEATIPDDRVVRDLDLVGDLRRIELRDDARLRFGGALDDGVDLVVVPDADLHNFESVPAGHPLGWVHPDRPLPVVVLDRAGRDVTSHELAVERGQLVTARPAVPVMMTRTVEAARKDCLTYLASDLPAA